MRNMNLTGFVKQAESILAERLYKIENPTKYIAGFKTRLGREIALERQRSSIYCWSEAVSLTGLENSSISPIRTYASQKTRNSNLNSKNCPRLQVGRPVYYWKFDEIEELELFLNWYNTAAIQG